MVTAKAKQKYSDNTDFKLLQTQIYEILLYANNSADECPYCEKLDRE